MRTRTTKFAALIAVTTIAAACYDQVTAPVQTAGAIPVDTLLAMAPIDTLYQRAPIDTLYAAPPIDTLYAAPPVDTIY